MKTIAIKDIFETSYGTKLDLNKMKLVNSFDDDAINFVSRTSRNLGITAKVRQMENVKPIEQGLITVALGGAILSSFVQPQPFYTGQNIMVLKPKVEMTFNEKLFYCLCIEKNKNRYSTFGREANRTLKDLQIPTEIPNWVSNIETNKYTDINQAIISSNIPLNTRNWLYFNLKDIFEFEKCKCSNASKFLKNGTDLYYIGAKKNDNGVMGKVEKIDNFVSKGNCIVFIGDGQGSVGYTTYQQHDFIGSTTLTCGYNKKLTIFNALFLVTILDLERYKYSFGRKYGKAQLMKAKVKLPANKDKQPDFEFMENYIKTLPYSKQLIEKDKINT